MQAPADYAEIGLARDLEELERAGFALDPLPEEAALVGPHYALALHGVAVTGELTQDQLEAIRLDHSLDDLVTSLRAGEGREFLVVYVTQPDPELVQSIGGGTAEVIVEGAARSLDRVPHDLEVLVVNVPAGEDATLAVSDAGETRSISLRTGRVTEGGGDSPADELGGDSVSLEDWVEVSGVTEPGYVERLLVTVGARPYSYLDEYGRAEPGRMWLEVGFELTIGGQVYEQAELQLDLPASLTLQSGRGDPIRIPADADPQVDSTTVPGVVLIEWSGVIEVPDSLRIIEVSYYTQGRFSDGSREIPFTRYDQENTGTLDLSGG